MKSGGARVAYMKIAPQNFELIIINIHNFAGACGYAALWRT